MKINRLKKGELVLLSIALEYLSFPALLVLNNPIMNLEYGEAIDVIRSLKRLSKRKSQPITIVFIADGINEDMLRLVDCVSIFTGMRLSFNISLDHDRFNSSANIDPNTPAQIIQQVEAVNALYSLITEASMELLRKPKHLQNTMVEDNLLKICNDLNGLKGIVQRDTGFARTDTVGIEVLDSSRDNNHKEDNSSNPSSLSSFNPLIKMDGSSNNASTSMHSSSTASIYKRTDSFIATRMRGRQVLQEHNDIIRSKMRSSLFKPFYKEIEILVVRELMFMTSNVSMHAYF